MAAQNKLLNARHERAHGAALFEPLFEIARLVQLSEQPTGFKGFGIGTEFVVRPALLQGVKCSLSSQHARLDGRVAAFDSAGIEVARFTPNQGTTGENGFGQRQ